MADVGRNQVALVGANKGIGKVSVELIVVVEIGHSAGPYVRNRHVATFVAQVADGRLEVVSLGGVEEVRITLKSPRSLKAAVVRGLAASAEGGVLEGSSDGGISWTWLATLPPASAFAEVALAAAPGPVSVVRLRSPQPEEKGAWRLNQLAELSLFE